MARDEASIDSGLFDDGDALVERLVLTTAPLAGPLTYLAPPGLAPQALAIDLNTRVAQGAIEGSNVEAMTEMTRLMEIHRSYDRAVRIIQEDDDLRKQMLSRLGQSA